MDGRILAGSATARNCDRDATGVTEIRHEVISEGGFGPQSDRRAVRHGADPRLFKLGTQLLTASNDEDAPRPTLVIYTDAGVATLASGSLIPRTLGVGN